MSDDEFIDKKSFSYRDMRGQDTWIIFTPTFTSITLVGAATYVGRFRIVGRLCYFQVTLLAATSIATTAGTTYMTLPVTARGLTGMGVMTNATNNVAVGVCHIDATNGRCYVPSQAASGNTFHLFGSYEV